MESHNFDAFLSSEPHNKDQLKIVRLPLSFIASKISLKNTQHIKSSLVFGKPNQLYILFYSINL